MSASREHDRQQRVGQSQPRPGAERRHYDRQQPFTPRWLPYVVQQPLDQIATKPVTGREPPCGNVTDGARSMVLPATVVDQA
jgi:hypothetical protein